MMRGIERLLTRAVLFGALFLSGCFAQSLTERGIAAFIRKPRGLDIFAACGQLKRTVEVTPASP